METPYSNGSPVNRSMVLHPYNVILTLTLAGITMLFLAFSAAYVYTRFQGKAPVIQLPLMFLFNTLVLIGSSMTMNWAKRCYENDDTAKYQQALIFTIVLTLIFMVLQMIGWRQLISQNVGLVAHNGASYLYLISGLHYAHVMAGLPFLILFLITANQRMKEPVSVLVYFLVNSCI